MRRKPPVRRVGFASHPSFLAHDTGPGHPERPQRLEAIGEHLRRTHLWNALTHLSPQPVRPELLELVHPRRHVEAIARACREGPGVLDADTHVSVGSFDAALRAVGAVTQSIDRVMDGELEAAFCAVRPPGHHALAARAMGFCLFNNVAIGARYAQQRHRLQRILIVDWDVHHGNGTQAIFYEDASVLYCSTHQFPFYPGTGARDDTGRGAGVATTVNMPLASGDGDEQVLTAMRENLVPRAEARRAYLEPLTDFVGRYGRAAVTILMLIGIYRVADVVMGVIANVFYLEKGFDIAQIATYSKFYGLIATIAGGFLGGIIAGRIGVARALFIGAVLAAASNLLFAYLAVVDADVRLLMAVITADNLSGGFAGAAFVAYLSSLTNVSFTATQYALFTSIMVLLPKLLAGYSGSIVDAIGYSGFFVFSALLGVPVLFLIVWLRRIIPAAE